MDLIANKLNKIKQGLIILIFLIGNISIYGTNFAVEVFSVGPNPYLISSHNLVVNYQSSVVTDATFYIYTVTGELVFSKSFTDLYAGDHYDIIAYASELASLNKQLYILYGVFEYENSTITKKAYFIAK